MCGIIGYCGNGNVKDVLINGLTELEYRGYDSTGIAFFTEEGIKTVKTVGKVDVLKEKLPEKIDSVCGIGHTRWATHGGVTYENAHPHTFGNVTLIHNGIIENYHDIGREMAEMGKHPVSGTDSEIAAILIDHFYTGDPRNAIFKAVQRLEGTYALLVMFKDQKDKIYCVRKGSPLVAAKTEDGYIVASDLTAIIRYTHDYFVVPEGPISTVCRNSFKIYDRNEKEYMPEILSVNWDMTAAQKNGYDHFMQKEIFEQPDTLRKTVSPRVVSGEYLLPDLTEDVNKDLFKNVDKIVVTACGTAMHSGLVGRWLIEKILRIPVVVETASEFRYMNPLIDEKTLVIVVSQSGETADTLAALRLAKEKGSKTLAIVNVKGSSIAREADSVIYTNAGPEISVASTKAYTAQVAVFYLLTFYAALVLEKKTCEEINQYMNSFLKTLDHIDDILKQEPEIKEVAGYLKNATDCFFIGRGVDYALSLEGSLKLKEISYIHSEAYAGGELKHGTLSLISDGVPVIALATQKDIFSKMISNVKEVRSRKATVIMVTIEDKKNEIEKDMYDKCICIPESDELFNPFLTSVVLQLIAYHTSVGRGIDVDHPRNLAKSVTVE